MNPIKLALASILALVLACAATWALVPDRAGLDKALVMAPTPAPDPLRIELAQLARSVQKLRRHHRGLYAGGGR